MRPKASVIGGVLLALAVLNTGSLAGSVQRAESGRNQGQQSGRRSGNQSRGPNDPKVRLPFWKDPAVIKEIRLTAEQAKQIDKLWNDRLKEMLGRVEEMHKQEDEFKRLVMGRTVSPDVVALQADRVEAQRTLLYKSRAVMLYRMSLVLTADQHKGMKTIWDRMFGFTSDHGNSGGRGR